MPEAQKKSQPEARVLIDKPDTNRHGLGEDKVEFRSQRKYRVYL